MSPRGRNYTAAHRAYVRSPEFSAHRARWHRRNLNLAPLALALLQGAVIAQVVWEVSWYGPAVVLALWAARRPHGPICRACGLTTRTEYHHLSYRALDRAIARGARMWDPADRARVARAERRIDVMALCRADHRLLEVVLELLKKLTGLPKKTLRRWVSWIWVGLVRTSEVVVIAWIGETLLRMFP